MNYLPLIEELAMTKEIRDKTTNNDRKNTIPKAKA
jgi:hypothetical protein